MSFATAWLKKNALFPELFREEPDIQTGIIVVIPACNEPGITTLLDSLGECTEPDCKVEVIIIINARAGSDPAIIQSNIESAKKIESWRKQNNSFLRLFFYNAGEPAIEGWGVGLARKTGMDEALRRFNAVNNPEGVIVSLDADCTVEKNYLISISDELLRRRGQKACSIYFEHPVTGNYFPAGIYRNIIQYELHLRYFVQGLHFCGFPYPFHTVGSAIAVKANSYFKAGGMNRKEAGEDFYFIQKLVAAGGYFALNSTIVFPSPRESARVPFGTGSMMMKMMERSEKTLFTYNIDAFRELKYLFSEIGSIYQSSPAEVFQFFESLPPGMKSFIRVEDWIEKTAEIRRNTSSLQSFRKRFFDWFNMFKVVKYLNHVHNLTFQKRPVGEEAFLLLDAMGVRFSSRVTHELLLFYRQIEKDRAKSMVNR
jgi:hypothetical protein